MKLNKIILSGGLVLGMMPVTALATPVKHAKCSKNITEPKNSSGYYMSADCKTAYVLPPRVGQMSVNGYRPTITSSTCGAIQKIEDRNEDNEEINDLLTKSIKRKAKKIANIDEMLEEGEIPAGTTEDELRDEMDELLLWVSDARSRLDDDFKNYTYKKGVYAQMEGGVGSFRLESNHSDLINQFVELNEGKKIHFARMPIKNNSLSIIDKSYNSEENKAEMKAVKRLRVAGKKVSTMDSAGEIANMDSQSPGSSDGQESLFGAALSGQIELSALGACAVERAAGDVFDFTMNDLKSDVSASAFYDYEVQVMRKYAVTYNFKELVHIVRESSSRGGFFSRKTVNKLIDTRKTSSWITFHSESDDTSYEYSDKDIKAIKAQFLDRALRQIIDIRTGGKATALALIDPSGKNGAQTIGDELAKCPHIYCQIGSAGFKILGAIFGSTKATSEVLKKIEGEAYETDEQRKMVTLIGSSAFE